MLSELERWIPSDFRHILLVGTPAAETFQRDDAEVETAAQLPATVGQPFDAIVFLSTSSIERLLAVPDQARPLLAEHGRLIFQVGATATSHRDLIATLEESGLTVLNPAEPTAAANGWIVARREKFRVRSFREGDQAQILALFESSFHRPRSTAYFDWEYRHNPYGNLEISMAFDDRGELVAHYAGYPVKFWRDPAIPAGSFAGSLPALHIGDTMTAASVRHLGRGPTSLLGRTVRHYYARRCEQRVAFNYGVNTGNIQRFSMKFLRIHRLEEIPFATLDLSARRPPSRLSSRLAGYRCQRLTGFDERWNRFWERARWAYRLLVERDTRYLDWRYCRRPDSRYQIYGLFRWHRPLGWGVFQRRENRLLWGDGLFDPHTPEAPGILLGHVLASPEQAGVTTVETWATPRPRWWAEACARLGFVRQPEPQGLGFGFASFGLDPEAIFQQHLYYTMGDFDLF